MKSVVAIVLAGYLLLGSFIPGNSFFEFSSMASLINHYQQHRAATHDISFLEFLKLHYSNPGHQKSDPKNHSNLPLQHQGNTPPADEIVNPFNSNTAIIVPVLAVKLVFLVPSYLPDNQFSSGVFHPPSVLS